jgi:serine/threonine protein kinase
MSDIPKVIGQGEYGCVLKPSLKCKDNPLESYDNKVSKIIRRIDAKKEMAEYIKVDKADKKNEFYLGKPVLCELEDIKSLNKDAIQKCKIGKDVIARLNNYELIIMEDGGENLETYIKQMSSWTTSAKSTELCEKFLLEILRLFYGVYKFEKHDLVHHDLKPQNIVYNKKNNRLNFIDFGLMQSRKKIINQANSSKYQLGIFHWSYPWELEFLNKDDFEKLKTAKSQQYKFNIVKNGINSLDEKNDYYSHSNSFLYYSYSGSYTTFCNKYIKDYELTLKTDINSLGYSNFLDKSLKTIDILGLGIALNYWLTNAKKHLDSLIVSRLESLFSRMVSGRLSDRILPEDALESYEEFINGSGLLEKYGKELHSHKIFDIGDRIQIILDKKPLKINKKIKPKADFVNADPNPCPEGKERNPITGRCNKIKLNKTVKKNSEEKLCPPGKERNPKTRRCVNKCKDGYTRNSEFKCVKE